MPAESGIRNLSQRAETSYVLINTKRLLVPRTFAFSGTASYMFLFGSLLSMSARSLTAQASFWRMEGAEEALVRIISTSLCSPLLPVTLTRSNPPLVWITVISSGPEPGAGSLKLLTRTDRLPGRGESPWLQSRPESCFSPLSSTFLISFRLLSVNFGRPESRWKQGALLDLWFCCNLLRWEEKENQTLQHFFQHVFYSHTVPNYRPNSYSSLASCLFLRWLTNTKQNQAVGPRSGSFPVLLRWFDLFW